MLIGFLTFIVAFVALFGGLTIAVYTVGNKIKAYIQKKKDNKGKLLEKRWFAPVPRPGTFIFQVNEGKMVRTVENVTGWKLDGEKFVLDRLQNKSQFRSLLAQELGALWLGPYSTIAIIKDWRWPEFKQIKYQENGKEMVRYDVEYREEDVSEFFFQYPYSVRIEDVELVGNIQATINGVFTVFFLYPRRAVFLNKNSVDLFIAMVRSAVRAWMCDKKFNVIKQISVSGNKSADKIPGFWQMIEELNGITFDVDGNPEYDKASERGLFGKLGIAIVRVELEQVEAEDKAGEALKAKELAEMQGEARIAAAKKTATELEEQAKGRLRAAEIDALAQRTLNEQNAGYFASLPGGARMFAAAQIASKDSSVGTWVEGGADVNVSLPLPPAPPKPPKPAPSNP